MTFVSDNTSQIESLRISLAIVKHNEGHDDLPCFLDAKALQLDTVAFSMVSKSINSFHNIISQFQDDIEISYSDSGGLNNTQPTTKVTSMDLGETQARTQESRRQIQELGSTKELSQNQFPGSQEDSEARAKSQQGHGDRNKSSIENGEDLSGEEDLYTASPEITQTKVLSPDFQTSKTMPMPLLPRGRKGVKPKAKPPIVLGRHSLDSNLTTAKSKTHVTGIKAAKADNRNGKGNSLLQARTEANSGVKDLTSAASATRKEQKDANAKAPSQDLRVAKQPIVASAAIKARRPAATKKVVKSSAVGSKTALASNTVDLAYDFSDNLIPSPDANDASTPKVSKAKSISKPINTVAKPIGTQSKSKIVSTDDSPAPVRKRYGLHKPTGNASNDTNSSTVGVKDTAGTNPAKPNPKSETKATKPGISHKADATKRQSAPAALRATRQSQRTAASKVKDKMLGADDSHDDHKIEKSSPTKPKSQAVEDKKNSGTQIPNKFPEKSASDLESYSPDSDQDISRLQAEDARSLGLAPDKSPLLEQDRDLYDASPRNVAKVTDFAAKEPKKVSISSKPAPRHSGTDLAHKLGESLGFLDSEPEQDERQLAIPTKPTAFLKSTIRQKGSQQAPSPTGEDESVQNAGDKIRAYDHKSDDEVLAQNPFLSEHDDAPSAPNADTSVANSPRSMLPDDPETPLPGTDAVPNDESPEVPYPPSIHETIETQVKTKASAEVLNAIKLNLPAQISDTTPVLLNTDLDIVTGDRIMLSEAVRRVDVVTVSKKRKPSPEEPPATKRRRAGEDNTQGVNEHNPDIVLPKAAAAKTTTKKPRKSKTSSASPLRRSPRLASKAAQQPIESKAAGPEGPETSIVVKDPNRKPQVINFGGQGPRNQGVASAAKPQNITSALDVQVEVSPVEVHAADRKRKREKANFADVVSPPKKKQNSSPVAGPNDYYAMEPNSSPPPRVAKPKQGRQRLSSRPSSQASRVDRNGSPIAGESPIDHFRKLKERLSESEVQTVPQDSKAIADVQTALVEEEITRPRRVSQIFGSKITLGGKLKARPSSPKEPNSRYVAHGEIHGVYTNVDTKQVVEENKVLPDPFVERNRKASCFIERLQSSASKEIPQAKNAFESRRQSLELQAAKGHRAASIRSNEALKLPDHTLQKPVLNINNQGLGFVKQGERKTRPIVYEQSSPSELTSGTSYGSQSSDAARTPLQEVAARNEIWNLAVRPHYNTLGQAIHRIADVSMLLIP
ncbi:hypothetical protein ONS95_008115 [Cadophora gregata]|uniref:uncharacterized protein n=1 Tax=Cadophora gregata TaxID=51156 RepID=UPI0026DC1739|nr:uncharacterized protein ONS95_008115 [Cadophora gregata]KAK0119266.1 hypothetical protein ONS96_012325 [Cadophora gregata f. sp. sojae]KAK0126520.1 hypothetical protein ONS95_008115 [Cadophora gregata]